MIHKLLALLAKICSKFNSYGEGETFVPRWGIVIPHDVARQGAMSADGRYSEYRYGKLMASMIELPYADRNNGGVAGAIKQLKAKKCNASVEVHFNAYNGHAHGAEILVLEGDDLSERYARLFVESFAERYKRKLRHDKGIKKVKRGDAGYINLITAKANGMKVAMLTELFFGDNYEEFIPPTEQAMFWESHLVPLADRPV